MVAGILTAMVIFVMRERCFWYFFCLLFFSHFGGSAFISDIFLLLYIIWSLDICMIEGLDRSRKGRVGPAHGSIFLKAN